MTKQRKPGAPPGNTNASKPEGTHYIRKEVLLRPDQEARLALEPNQSAVVRAALDLYIQVLEHETQSQ